MSSPCWNEISSGLACQPIEEWLVVKTSWPIIIQTPIPSVCWYVQSWLLVLDSPSLLTSMFFECKHHEITMKSHQITVSVGKIHSFELQAAPEPRLPTGRSVLNQTRFQCHDDRWCRPGVERSGSFFGLAQNKFMEKTIRKMVILLWQSMTSCNVYMILYDVMGLFHGIITQSCPAPVT